MGSVRDFRESTREKLIEKVKSMQSVKLMFNLLKDFGYSNLFLILNNPVLFFFNIKKINERIRELTNTYILRINSAFDEAQIIDETTAAQGDVLLQDGKQLADKLKTLVEVASSGRLDDILTNPAFFDANALNEDSGVFVDVSISAVIPQISDDELIEAIPRLSASAFSQMINNGCAAVCNMGLWTAFLISLYQHKDILTTQISEILTGSAGTGYRIKIVEKILCGAEGYDTVAQIAQELNLSEDMAAYFLTHGNLIGYGTTDFNTDYKPELLYNEAERRAKLNQIIERNLDRIVNNDEMFREFAESCGVDEVVLQAVIDGKYDSYIKSIYEETAAESLAAICEQQEIKVLPEGIEKIQGWIKTIQNGMQLKDHGAMSKDLEDIIKKLDKGENAEKQIKAFLHNYCGKDKGVKASDISSFAILAKSWGIISTGSKHLAESVDGIECLAKWTAEYEAQLKIVDQLISINSNNPEYRQALLDLREDYTSRNSMILNDVLDIAVEKGIDKAFDAWKPLKLAETAISFAGTITGTKGYADAAQKVISLSLVSSEAFDQYHAALERVSEGDTSSEALQGLRSTFAFAKQSLYDYYIAQADYYKGFLHENDNPRMVVYLEHEAFRLKEYDIGETFEPMSYDDFIKQYGN